MAGGELNVAAAALVLGVGAGAVISARLASRGYRYDEERELPRRSLGWFVPVTTLALTIVVLAWWSRDHMLAMIFGIAVLPLMALVAIDLDTRRLPNSVTYPFAGYAALASVLHGSTAGDSEEIQRALLCGVALAGAYLVLVLLGGGKGMGLGDAKLALGLGTLLGMPSVAHVLMATVLTFVLAGVHAMVLLLRGASRQTTIAFGPYMVLGAICVLAAPAISLLVGRSAG